MNATEATTDTMPPKEMPPLELAIASALPIIWVRTDDVINVEDVLAYIAGPNKKVAAVRLPDVIKNINDLKIPDDEDVLYTSDECKYLPKLYRYMVEKEKTIVFVNTDESKVHFNAGSMVPPKGLVLEFLTSMLDGVLDEPKKTAAELLPAFGGLTLKDIAEVAKMTMTRDQSLTIKGVNSTRKGYTKLQGITQVETDQNYYVAPDELTKWMQHNAAFFTEPKHPSLIPRGLLAGGPPGTGKTEASKAIAQAFGVPLYRLDLGTMMGKYVGESEGNLNSALAQIDEVEPCVVIFDEVEKVFQGHGGDSGVTSRMLSQLLWWLQEHKSRVFTVMTTNNVSAIPVELYRPGRIDKVLDFLGISQKTEGYAFAKGAFDTLLSEMSASASQEDYDKLGSAVNLLYANQTAVPQVKLIEEVKRLVRECLSPATAEAEATPAPAPETVKKGAVKLKISNPTKKES